MDCGDCTLCCTLLTVKDLDKPAGVACNHCGEGCNIYEDRPQGCRDFTCAYAQMEEVNIALRPDHCGVVFEVMRDDLVLGMVDSGRGDYPHVSTQVKMFVDQGANVVMVENGLPAVYPQPGAKVQDLIQAVQGEGQHGNRSI